MTVLHKNIKKAFEGVGLKVTVRSGLTRGWCTYVGYEAVGPKAKAKWEADLAGKVRKIAVTDQESVSRSFGSIGKSLSRVMSFCYTRYLNGATVSVKCLAWPCRTGGGLTYVTEIVASRRAVKDVHGRMYEILQVKDDEGNGFWRGEPEDGIIADWLEDHSPEAAKVIGRGDPRVTPAPVITLNCYAAWWDVRNYTARLTLGDQRRELNFDHLSPLAEAANRILGPISYPHNLAGNLPPPRVIDREHPDWLTFWAAFEEKNRPKP
jgi:hypothetical protein